MCVVVCLYSYWVGPSALLWWYLGICGLYTSSFGPLLSSSSSCTFVSWVFELLSLHGLFCSYLPTFPFTFSFHSPQSCRCCVQAQNSRTCWVDNVMGQMVLVTEGCRWGEVGVCVDLHEYRIPSAWLTGFGSRKLMLNKYAWILQCMNPQKSK